GLGQQTEFEVLGRRLRGRGVGRVAAGAQHLKADAAVEAAGVEEIVAVVPGEAPRQRALAGRRRPVDGDDHAKVPPVRGPPVAICTSPAARMSAPSARMKSPKPGKLVSMNSPSSTVTGRRAPRPSTRKLIAMR